MALRYEGVVDLRRYPINDPARQEYLDLVTDCRDALHRVTPVSGPRPRINSVLTYGEHPGMKLTELTQQLFYGRTA